MLLPVYEILIIVTYVLFFAVSEIWWITGPIRCLNGVPLFNTIVWGEPLKSVLQNLVIIISYGAKRISIS